MSKVFNYWKSVAKKVGSFQASIFFTLLYFILIVPIGTFLKIKFQNKNISKMNYWRKRPATQYSLEWAKKQ